MTDQGRPTLEANQSLDHVERINRNATALIAAAAEDCGDQPGEKVECLLVANLAGLCVSVAIIAQSLATIAATTSNPLQPAPS